MLHTTNSSPHRGRLLTTLREWAVQWSFSLKSSPGSRHPSYGGSTKAPTLRSHRHRNPCCWWSVCCRKVGWSGTLERRNLHSLSWLIAFPLVLVWISWKLLGRVVPGSRSQDCESWCLAQWQSTVYPPVEFPAWLPRYQGKVLLFGYLWLFPCFFFLSQVRINELGNN